VDQQFDVVVVGAGTAGIPTALEAAGAGARVLIVEKDDRIGGTLHTTGGHIAAAGTQRQKSHGIEDSPEAWMDDIRRITRDQFREDLMGQVVEHATEFVDWLDEHGFRFDPVTPRIIYGHEPYYTARTYYGTDAGVSLLDVFKPLLDEAIATGTVTLWTQSPVLGLLTDDAGDVTGVTVQRRGQDVDVHAPHVILATGGFAADKEMFEELVGYPLVSAAHPTSTGDGLLLAQDIGARFQGEGIYLPTFGGLPHPTTPGRVQWEERPVLTQERPPWEIYVDRAGNRWCAEDEPSIDLKERMLLNVPDLTFWTIFDDQGVENSVPIVVNWTPEDVRARANIREGVQKADTLEELAAITGIDEAGLLATVAKYNGMVETGEDPDFGRTFFPAPIAQGPFYALRNHGITLVTFIGIDTDEQMRARREDGSVIAGLYAIGEVTGAAATTGQSFCSGMLITPGVVLGRMLGARLGAQVSASTDPTESGEAATR
jgi:succinate dehydrogenase/fumarate reductase flavoprotein subunit